jgi:subtilisin family serine protease
MILTRDVMEQLMFGTGRVRRFTQDSPVLPDVWLEYAKESDDETGLTAGVKTGERFPPVKLLLTPYKETAAGEVRKVLRKRLDDEGRHKPRVVYNQSTIAATLYFEELIRVVLPMTQWWATITARWPLDALETADGQADLAKAVMDPEHPPIVDDPKDPNGKRRLPPDLLWMMRVVGALALVRTDESLPAPFAGPKPRVGTATPEDWIVLVRAVARLAQGVQTGPPSARIHSVSLNREATLTVARSTLAVKADAARRLFNISCKDVHWVVIDAGVDATHPAFRLRDAAGKPVTGEPFADPAGQPVNNTRVRDTYDFTQIELLFDPDTKDLPERVKTALQLAPGLQEELDSLNEGLKNGRSIDWKTVAPLLRVPHDGNYVPPRNDHGTHVAGILAGDWRSGESSGLLEEDLIGVCPDLQLYDFRVLNDEGRGDEFGVMAALQFARYLNSTNDYMAVHGVNLSLSIPHDVSNYACGRTPVCEECERVVSAGIVVVAAAGNQGYRKYTTAEGMAAEAYNSISITDPGNAELVITVGATHRYRPHMYGVSYFSSRGPTGDGRQKPDLVAPGEKITAPLPLRTFGLKDGTSMAAPHVSGAAALLMARYDELLGQPERIKKILCDTATDLGRERYFQGAGMLDVLRALQSV